jgi:hypothetical protein
MADWPANGDTDWNTKMKANIDVGHDSDGTHKKSQMLTDMEWSPTAYGGEQSITLPNGLIFKQGQEVVAANTTDEVTYSVAFNTFTNSWATFREANTGIDDPCMTQAKSGSETTILQVTNASQSQRTISWFAIGY